MLAIDKVYLKQKRIRSQKTSQKMLGRMTLVHLKVS